MRRSRTESHQGTKADFGLDSFALGNFWATEAALGFAMLAYNLMSLFRQAIMRAKV